jgi:hydroxylysine kinase
MSDLQSNNSKASEVASTDENNTSKNNTSKNSAFNSSAPDNSADFTIKLASQYYGLEVINTRLLACERDQIFLLTTADSARYVWRYTHPAEDRAVSNFQTQMMLHLSEDAPNLPIPLIIPSSTGENEILVTMENGEQSIVRLISFLQGSPMADFGTCSTALRQSMASNLAQLDVALKYFSHAAQHHKLLWDIQHVLELRDLQHHVQDETVRNLVAEGLDNYEQHVLPVLPSLRKQVIHNDLNHSNALVESAESTTLLGIIDFGDAVYAPLIQELGVAAAYHVVDTENPLTNVLELVTCFHKILPLQKKELAVLFDMIIARCVMTIVITEWRASLYPNNRDYILRNHAASTKGLKRLIAFGRDSGLQVLSNACRPEHTH